MNELMIVVSINVETFSTSWVSELRKSISDSNRNTKIFRFAKLWIEGSKMTELSEKSTFEFSRYFENRKISILKIFWITWPVSFQLSYLQGCCNKNGGCFILLFWIFKSIQWFIDPHCPFRSIITIRERFRLRHMYQSYECGREKGTHAFK